MKEAYTVYYRDGNPDNFKWIKVIPVEEGKEMARKKQDELFNQGYVALYEKTERLEAIGLPETYKP